MRTFGVVPLLFIFNFEQTVDIELVNPYLPIVAVHFFAVQCKSKDRFLYEMQHWAELGWESCIFRKTIICEPLIRRDTCAYQGVRNVSF